jgi:hypothetical protein
MISSPYVNALIAFNLLPELINFFSLKNGENWRQREKTETSGKSLGKIEVKKEEKTSKKPKEKTRKKTLGKAG